MASGFQRQIASRPHRVVRTRSGSSIALVVHDAPSSRFEVDVRSIEFLKWATHSRSARSSRRSFPSVASSSGASSSPSSWVSTPFVAASDSSWKNPIGAPIQEAQIPVEERPSSPKYDWM